ncbi:MAG: lipid-A-disaccharide synthase [Phycisphaerae bacterium]|nr:lipid-A-disaccharide synthase [Planctomycetia bacterium]MCK6463554.1 lipid-A-disaccharide synthase [Phycisphaerae bacterium]MCL4719035.1 lipid-A-disaccharide synthase [Phycisphaerae bacterium]NUQ07824.1 lipid-A-disaccharide synthase [Phycisphaerae bacterium]
MSSVASSVQGEPQRHFFLSAAEPSADRYAAAVIRALSGRSPGMRFTGVAGPAMQAEGCRALANLADRAAMLTGVVGLLRTGYRILKDVDRCFAVDRPDAVILVDSPTLHLPMARIARRHHIPVIYYVAPQLWAWAAWRIGRVRRRVNRLAVILPFEEAYFRARGVNAEYVGHPLFEVLRERAPDPEEVAGLRRLGDPILGLMPGSRAHVVSEVLPGQIEVVERLLSRGFSGISALVSAATPSTTPIVERLIAESRIADRLHIRRGDSDALIAASDLVLTASGTSTLHIAHYRKPMIVMYQASWLFYHAVGRWLVRTPRLSLPNIIAGRDIVPEFMPYYHSTAPIAEAASRILTDASTRERMIAEIEILAAGLNGSGVAQRVADMALEELRKADSKDIA